MKDAYRQVRNRIGEAAERAGRRAEEITLVAVTKNATPDQIRSLVELGHADLGENRVQQLGQRVAQLEEFVSRHRTLGRASTRMEELVPPKVRWHMIGHLQRNKIKHVAPLVSMIHSVDSLRLAEELHAFGNKRDIVSDVLLQVNVSGETSKYGIAVPAVSHVAEQLDTMMHLRVRGLMTMAPYADDPEDVRHVFARTRELFLELKQTDLVGPQFNILSMGMSNDFEVAIEEGANVVRVGRALFGEAAEEEQ